jgi:hypothetical protein
LVISAGQYSNLFRVLFPAKYPQDDSLKFARFIAKANARWEHPNFAIGINTQRQEQRKGGK